MNRRLLLPLLAAAVCVPLVVAVVVVAGDHWHPSGDMAQAELHVRGFFAHPPLVGAAGRLGPLDQQGSHPGPSMWFLLLPTYRLLGSTGWSLEAGVAVVAAVSIVGALVVARRRGGVPLLVLVAAALAVLVASNGPAVFTEPWNPWSPVLPFLLFVLLVWSVLEDDRAALPWAAALGTHCVQSHVGYAPLVGALGLAAAVVAVRRRWWRPVALAAGVGALLWLPPIVDQLGASGDYPGNLSILFHYFRSPDAPVVGLGGAAKAVAGELNLAGPWLAGRGHQPTDAPVWVGFVAMAGSWAAAAWVAWKRSLRSVLRLHVVLAGAWLVGLVAMSRVFGEFFDYVVRWASTLAALVAVAVAWTAAAATAEAAWRPQARRVAFGAVAVAVGFGVVASLGAESSGLRNSSIVAALGPPLAQRLEALDPDGRYLVRWDDSVSLNATGVGVLLDLEHRGFRVGADRVERAAVLPSRVLPEAEATAIVHVEVGPAAAALRERPGIEVVATFDPRTPEEARRTASVAAAVDARLHDLGLVELTPVLEQSLVGVAIDPRVPRDVADDVEELIRLGLPATAFVERRT